MVYGLVAVCIGREAGAIYVPIAQIMQARANGVMTSSMDVMRGALVSGGTGASAQLVGISFEGPNSNELNAAEASDRSAPTSAVHWRG